MDVVDLNVHMIKMAQTDKLTVIFNQNDRFGNPAGDFPLRRGPGRFRKCARATDIVSRGGGEEFAVIHPASTTAGALIAAVKIRTGISGKYFISWTRYTVILPVSIGIYSSEDGGVSHDRMDSLADEAAYIARNPGKNRIIVKGAA